MCVSVFVCFILFCELVTTTKLYKDINPEGERDRRKEREREQENGYRAKSN